MFTFHQFCILLKFLLMQFVWEMLALNVLLKQIWYNLIEKTLALNVWLQFIQENISIQCLNFIVDTIDLRTHYVLPIFFWDNLFEDTNNFWWQNLSEKIFVMIYSMWDLLLQFIWENISAQWRCFQMIPEKFHQSPKWPFEELGRKNPVTNSKEARALHIWSISFIFADQDEVRFYPLNFGSI